MEEKLTDCCTILVDAWITSLHLLLTDKPAIAPPVFVFQKDKAQKVSLCMLFKVFIEAEAIFCEFL